MSGRLIFVAAGLALLYGAGPVRAQTAAPGAPPTVTLPAELDRVLRDYEHGWRTSDADALAALFTPDGFILRPGHAPVRGRAAIAEAYREAGGPLHLRAFAFAHEDSVGYLLGGYRYEPDEEAADTGKFTLALRRLADGCWYIASDMDNGNR